MNTTNAEDSQTPRAVVLLSGGLDSATVAAMAKATGFSVYGLSFDYGQRHIIELEAARAIANDLALTAHHTVQVDLRAFTTSALTDPTREVPKDSLSDNDGIPITYVPARNTIFLSVALGLAEVVGAFDLFFGANAIDYSGYPDCRPAFVNAFEQLANVATADAVEGRGRYRIHAPLISMTKSDIIRKAVSLEVDLAKTHSCYDPIDGKACGRCDSCVLRKRGFAAAGIQDPTLYA